MKKIKFLSFLFVFLMLAPVSFAYANDEDYDNLPADAVVIPYNRALQMAKSDVLAIQDLGVAIRNMQTNHRDVRHQLQRLERGDARNEAIHTLIEAMGNLEMELHSTIQLHSVMNQQIERSLQGVLTGMANVGSEAELNILLQNAMGGMVVNQNLDTAIGAMEAQRNMLFDELQALYDDDNFRDIIDDARRGINELERQIENLRLSQGMVETGVEQALRAVLVGLDEMDRGIETLEANLELMAENLRRTRISYEVGVISSHDLRTMEHTIAGMEARLEGLILSRSALMQNLNMLLGQPLTQNTVVEFNRTQPSVPSNQEQHIARLISQAPTIRQLEFAIESAKAERRAYTGNDRDIRITDAERRRALNNPITGTSRNEQEIRNDEEIRRTRNRMALQEAVDRAITDRDLAVRAMNNAIRSAFIDLISLEAQVLTHDRDLEQAKATLNVAIANYNAGRVTRFDVEQAQLAVTTAEQNLYGIHNQMWILAFQIENPSML